MVGRRYLGARDNSLKFLQFCPVPAGGRGTSDISAWHCAGGGAALLTVLGHISRWAGNASVGLQRWWAAAALQLEGRDPAPPGDLLEADARQRLEVHFSSSR